MSRWILGLGFGMASWLVYDLGRKARDRRRIALEKKRLDERLDEALMDSFPASDPPALISPQR